MAVVTMFGGLLIVGLAIGQLVALLDEAGPGSTRG